MPLLKKLQQKEQSTLFVWNLPSEIGNDWKELEQSIKITDLEVGKDKVNFLLGFVQSEEEVNNLLDATKDKLIDECLFWIAYPKKSSKKYQPQISRDCGWQALGKLSYEPVRQIAIDEDWSALRFRKVENIRKLTRNSRMILSEEGRRKKAQRED